MTQAAIVALAAVGLLAALSLALAWASFDAGHVFRGGSWLVVTLCSLAFAALIVRMELRDRRRAGP